MEKRGVTTNECELDTEKQASTCGGVCRNKCSGDDLLSKLADNVAERPVNTVQSPDKDD